MHYKKNNLYIENIAVEKIAKKIGTPTYCYSLNKLKSNINDFKNNFNLYLGLEQLSELFSETGFLIMFWCHFLAINLFCGSWIVSDSLKFSMSKFLVFFPLLITYFIGPIGLFIYWLIRIFFAKKLSLYD